MKLIKLAGSLGILLICLSCTDRKDQLADGAGSHQPGKSGAVAGDVPFSDYPASNAAIQISELAAGVVGAGFTKLTTEESGISFFTDALSREMLLEDLGSQAGVAAADYDGDGDIDLYLCGVENDNLLFRNDGGMHFTDVTDEAGSALRIAGQIAESAVFLDINADQHLDLYVAVRDGVNMLFVNSGDGTFTEQTQQYGIDSGRATIVSAVFDFDNDGDLDIYNANNRLGRNEDNMMRGKRRDGKEFGFVLNEETGEVNLDEESSKDYYMDNATKVHVKPDTDEFFINDGSGHFQDKATQIGIHLYGWSLNALACDFNNDGWTDLQVSGDFDTPDLYYLNNGKGYLKEQGREMLRINSYYGMGSDAGDLNHDGWMDYIVGDMSPTGYKDSKKQSGDMNDLRFELSYFVPHQNMRNTVFLNRGDGWMTEAAALLGVKSTDWTWSIRLADLNADGLLEVLATNGYISRTIEYDEQKKVREMLDAGISKTEIEDYKLTVPPLLTQDVIFTSDRPLHYQRAPDDWGISDNAVSCGCILQDLDGDGDLDYVVNRTNDDLGVYRNDLPSGNQVLIDLRQPGANTEAVGARVIAWCGEDQFMQDVILARGYASTESSRIHLGLGKHEKIDSLWIRWPGNRCEVLRDLAVNSHYTIEQGTQLVDAQPQMYAPLFRQEELGFEQLEANTFDAEFAAEPLLPVRRSSLGTGLGVADVNGDGMLDAYFAGAAGQLGKLYVGRNGGTLLSTPLLDKVTDERQENMAVLFLEANADGRPDLLLSSGSNEFPAGDPKYLDKLSYNLADGFSLGGIDVEPVSSGSACAADIDNDGDLDIFIAGRQKVGEYLHPEHSHIMFNDGRGNFSLATGRVAPGLADIGPISDAVFSDLNGDGRPDLLLSLEFGSVEWWANNDGLLVRQGPISPSGVWQSLATGDFDNDGDMDVLAGNYGLNTKYHPSESKPYMIIADDFDDNGTRDLIEVKFGSDGTMLPGRGRSCSGYAVSTIPERFPTWSMFADASLEDVYGPIDQVAEKYTADKVESCLLLNDGSGVFSVQDLPLPAQYSIVFGMAVGDFDNDGNLDAWLNQNYRNTQPEETRWVSGYGCLLLGDGSGGFTSLEPLDSGMRVNAEGRGAVAADMNGDGSLDLLLSVSGAHAQVGWGIPESGKGQGLSVSLQGPVGNPTGVGARLSLELSDGRVLQREVQDGHTYLSSYLGPVHFGIPTGVQPQKLTVLWPGGSTSEVSSFDGSGSISVVMGQ